MSQSLRLAFTADLHWGIRAPGDEATRALVAFLSANPPDVLILAGDIGAGKDFLPCLQLFKDLPCRKALVPGNHDVWVENNDARGDSLQLYDEYLPRLCQETGIHYLDHGPILLPEAGVGIVGTMNWYDYSWSMEELKKTVPDYEERLRRKRFSRGMLNDYRFVRWRYDDAGFTREVVAKFRTQLDQALAQVPRVIAVTHHPACRAVLYQALESDPTMDALLWIGFSGNRSLEEVLEDHSAQIPFIFSGHTHREREGMLKQSRAFNIGGDYHFKRLIMLEWPERKIETHTFYPADAAGKIT